MPDSTYHEQVSERLRQIAAAMAARGARSMWGLHASLLVGHPEPDLLEVVRRGLRRRSSAGRILGGPFEILPAVLLLRRWEGNLPGEAVALIHELMTGGVHERGNTENHWLMYYTGQLLAAERWPDEPSWWNGLPAAAVAAEARRWILGMIDRAARIGHHEYDSPGYHIEHLAPLIGLAEHAGAEVAVQAERAATMLIADMALEYYRGSWAGGHSREGYRQNTWTRSGPVQGLQYAYFGGLEFDAELHCNHYIGPVLAAGYRPPALLADIAWDREAPHVVRKTKAPRTIFRHASRPAGPVRKYTYLSRSFALGSTQVGLPGAPAGPIDLVSWDLTWEGPKHEAKIVCNHPYRSVRRFSAFLTELPQAIGRSVTTGKPYLQFADRLFGASPFEQLMQHEGTLIALYRIPPDDDRPYLNLYLPRTVPWTERDGWLFGDTGRFHVGLRPLGPYQWERILEANDASIMVTDGDLIDGWLLRITGRDVGIIVEAAEPEACGSLEAFAGRRRAAHLDLSGWPGDRRVIAASIAGRRLDMTYDGDHLVDGEAIRYDDYPLYDAPWVEAPPGTGRMRFHHGGQELVVDFGVDPSRPPLPMRVIG